MTHNIKLTVLVHGKTLKNLLIMQNVTYLTCAVKMNLMRIGFTVLNSKYALFQTESGFKFVFTVKIRIIKLAFVASTKRN